MRLLLLVMVTGLLAHFSRAADTAPVKKSDVFEFTGRTEAAALVEIRPRVTGYLTKLVAKEGAAVKKGDLLAEIDPRPFQIEVDAAQARLAQSEAHFRLTVTESDRVRKLFDSRAVAAEEMERMAARATVARAAFDLAKVELTRAQLTLSATKLTSPIDGRLGRFQLSEGNLVVADGGPSIVTVIGTDPVFGFFDVDERTLLRLRRAGLAEAGKLTVSVGLADEDGYPHQTRLEFIDPRVDPATATVRFRTTLPNPKGLFVPGMFIRVRIVANADGTAAPARQP
ncbi:efflux RND transporter periplasmic adaptor subunit [Fimbriiglobus ruber]|uniref:RND efflux system, membrane fusion protein CmeA n=1 Tax=Fimbriiglobus ruber TaxID=1908690 RepID=A0A225E8U1_9BACT|nr:efflux RND transporter periplasmic adaptor subunit [Fimbriiglobus ruber]OWK47178.1 RND efflux system, membrane fusion protein CmeA [Fimbriiglobus ruber]